MAAGARLKREPMEQQRTLFRGLGRSRIALESSLARVWGPVAGVDEVGRGCLAGPVVAAAVILPVEAKVKGITDSKLLAPAKREKLDREIRREAIAVGVGVVDPEEIDRINILNASLKAMSIAVGGLATSPAFLLIDGVFKIPQLAVPQQVVVKGDYRCRCIGAASIVAKVFRDRLMAEMDRTHPGYGFADHKGYSCPSHRKALADRGASPIHRKSFFGVLPPGAEEDEEQPGLFEAQPEAGEKKASPSAERRRASLALGAAAESRVLERLMSEGWELLDRNWRCKAGELDLVVAKGETLAFVEVKALEDVDGPDDWQPEIAVAPGKRQKLARAARLWLIANEARARGLFPRFDVVTVAGSGDGARIEHLVDAFESPGG